MLRKGIGIDIGTRKTVICTVEDGILLKEPTVAAVDINTDEVLEAGKAALRMAEESPDRIRLCWPVWDPVVKCADQLSAMLKIFFKRALGHTVLRPNVMVSIPCDLSEPQISALENAVLQAGASRVQFLEAPRCAALGAGFDFASPAGQMLVHMGASRTEVAMIFIGDIVTYSTVLTGGNQMDSAIVRYLREKHHLLIGKRTAEQIKIRLVNLSGNEEEKKLDVKGRTVEGNQPKLVTLSSREMLSALKEPLTAVLDAVISVVEQTGDDMRADIAKGGVVLTGGAVLAGTDQFLADVMGLRTRIAPNAESAAAEGAAIALNRLARQQ